ncbi:popeye domain-containing protein 3-like isoform X3 [Neocloeon triangulifer]|uniref:popeye domain-containing protein 3-like isoform X3 n=1 Tax=Neocloeon triangulifer TaxID=2078957 RepID=UPI00286F42C1|nr:popeye domain-containing protein 3-like isoform X3 [Neocloeon triangulifer]
MGRCWALLLLLLALGLCWSLVQAENTTIEDEYGPSEEAEEDDDEAAAEDEGTVEEPEEEESGWMSWPSRYNISVIASMLDNMYCAKWGPANHMYFQLANTFFLLSYLAPNGTYGILYLRSTLLVGCALFALWGWTVLCSLDAFLWNANFVAINFIHVCVLLYYLRPVKFSKEIEEVYIALFYPLKVSRHQFKKVLNCMKEIRALRYQEVYAHEKSTKVDSLSLVLSGKLVVSQNGRALHIVFPHQFLDSPEWFGVSTDEYFQVSITAMEEARVLLWHRDKLKLSIITDQFLQAVFDHILGRDVVKKLMQVSVSETMAASNNGNLPNNFDDAEDKPMLLIKKPGDGPGISALINRQIQAADPNAWRLGRIEETDHETTV